MLLSRHLLSPDLSVSSCYTHPYACLVRLCLPRIVWLCLGICRCWCCCGNGGSDDNVAVLVVDYSYETFRLHRNEIHNFNDTGSSVVSDACICLQRSHLACNRRSYREGATVFTLATDENRSFSVDCPTRPAITAVITTLFFNWIWVAKVEKVQRINLKADYTRHMYYISTVSISKAQSFWTLFMTGRLGILWISWRKYFGVAQIICRRNWKI